MAALVKLIKVKIAKTKAETAFYGSQEYLNQLQKAAELGDKEALKELDLFFKEHQNLKKQLVEWKLVLANKGDLDAQVFLAETYAQGFEGMKSDPKSSAEWYLKAAEQGNFSAQYKYAEYCIKGFGVEKDYKLAIEYFKRAADQGEVGALICLGEMYEFGKFVDRDLQIAKRFYQKIPNINAKYNYHGYMERINIAIKAGDGDIAAQIHLVEMYMKCNLIFLRDVIEDKNDEKYLDEIVCALLFKIGKTETENNDWVQYNCGYYCEKGRGTKTDLVAACKWYDMAYKNGNKDAQYALERLGKIKPKPRPRPKVDKVIQPKKTSFEELRELAAQNNYWAQCELGKIYATGAGVACDLKVAFDLYQKAALQGYPEAQYQLAMAYQNGNGVAQDFKLAREWFQIAAEQGGPKLQSAPSRMAPQSINGLDNPTFSWSRNAQVDFNESIIQKSTQVILEELQARAEAGDPDAQYELGFSYERGFGVPKDSVLATKWYQEAAKQDHHRAKEAIKSEFEKMKEKASDGELDAQFELGSLYTYGFRGAPKDLKLARYWFEKAASSGSNLAKIRLEKLDELERSNGHLEARSEAVSSKQKQTTPSLTSKATETKVSSEKSEFETLMEKAKAGDPRSQVVLSLAFETGKIVGKDEVAAFQWLEVAVKNPKIRQEKNIYAQSLVRLGLMCENAQGGEKDDAKAAELFLQAATLDDAHGQYHCGRMCYLGKGVPRNYYSAYSWFSLAANQNHVDAQYMLGVFYQQGLGMLASDFESAWKWYQKAEKNGCAKSGDALKKLDNYLHAKSNQPLVAAKTGNKTLDARIGGTESGSELQFGDANLNSEVNTTTVQYVSQSKKNLSALSLSPSTVEIKISQEQLEFLTSLQATGIKAEDLQQLQQKFKECPLSSEEWLEYKSWVDAFSGKLKQLEKMLNETNLSLAKDPQSQNEQHYIDIRPKLKNYQRRVQKELSIFVTCYFLAPAGIFKMDGDKRDTAIEAMGSIPLVGDFLKVFTSALSFANATFRIYQMNRLNELFNNIQHITDEICTFSRRVTMVQELTIEQQTTVKAKGFGKVKEFFKKVKEKLDYPGIKLEPEDKMALLDVAYLLEQILSGEATIDRQKDLSLQFVEVLTGEEYKPRAFNATMQVQKQTLVVMAQTTVVSTAPGPLNSLTNRASRHSVPQGLSMEDVERLMNEQNKKQEEAIQDALRKHKEEFEHRIKTQEEENRRVLAGQDSDRQKLEAAQKDLKAQQEALKAHQKDLKAQQETLEAQQEAFRRQKDEMETAKEAIRLQQEKASSIENLANRFSERLTQTEEETAKLKKSVQSEQQDSGSNGNQAQAQLNPTARGRGEVQKFDQGLVLDTVSQLDHQVRFLVEKVTILTEDHQNTRTALTQVQTKTGIKPAKAESKAMEMTKYKQALEEKKRQEDAKIKAEETRKKQAQAKKGLNGLM